MKLGLFLGIIGAVLLHVGFILFGGLLIPNAKPDHGTLAEVELLEAEDPNKPVEEKSDEPLPDEIKTEQEAPPDSAEVLRNLESPIVNDAPSLDASSLSAIEAALNGSTGGGDFAQSMDFTSGGRIGGTGKAGTLEERLDEAFSLAEIDQKPRSTFQASPVYPTEMRGKKVEGMVSVIFIVDAGGKVLNPRVEKSNNPVFEKPALEAVRKWKFEPAIKGGERVACRMRAPIRFPPS